MFLLQQETMHYSNLVVCSSNLIRLALKISLFPSTHLNQTEKGHSVTLFDLEFALEIQAGFRSDPQVHFIYHCKLYAGFYPNK